MVESIIVEKSLNSSGWLCRTRQLLMLSGVRHADVLMKLGVEVKLDQSEVGQNMHEQILVLPVVLIDNSRGLMGVPLANISDPPVIDTCYFSTALERYAA
ncbi:versicolorin reductase [Colletotrichum spaethianum]|uniref:Versicolorin reductase n=1 Tax=Colletotrichum spaethianum TaxID=700344 RepID=A0AA37UJE8_9PEZI|nr:versicolorin reductase [Colletotrichum spaethianum]GKT47866.1 versicolorin reductase [Colletotrichum spaethianum]